MLQQTIVLTGFNRHGTFECPSLGGCFRRTIQEENGMSNRVRNLLSVGIGLACFTVPMFAGGPPIPEPSTVVLVGIGVAGIFAVQQIRARSKKK
jgi:PEP-CTERM motif